MFALKKCYKNEKLKLALKLTYFVFFFFVSVCSFAQLRAGFTSDVTEGCSPLLVRFKDQSKGAITSWKWDLGNGTISFIQNPSTIYNLPGTYTVKLIVSNDLGEDVVVKEDYIHVYKNPSIDFSAVPAAGCPPLLVNFNNFSTAGEGVIDEVVWDFGDGQISSEMTPSHLYSSAGTFGITLSVKNSYGCKTTTYKADLINVFKDATANFTYTYENVCSPPTEVTFQNLSASERPTTYLWDFGNGVTSIEKDPQYTYTETGNYTVTLYVTTDQGCVDTISKSISVGSVSPDFLVNSKTCLNKPVTFINNSSPLPVNATWSFGDGTTAEGIDAEHTFMFPGTYEVKMTADFETCTGSISKSIVVAKIPVAAFSVAEGNTDCHIPSTINFKNESSNSTSYIWYFGDGDSSFASSPSHTYLQEGKYTVTLISSNGSGCADTLVMPDFIQIGPPEIVSLSPLPVGGCAPVIINPKPIINTPEPIASYLWDFGDGTTSSDPSPIHQYNNQGTYNVTLTITTTSGCTDILTVQNGVKVGSPPIPDFSATPTEVCADQSVSFTDLSTGDITSWMWYFGDGSVSTDQNPRHEFNDTGYFDIVLVIENNGCSDSIVKLHYVKVNPPVAQFGYTFKCTDQFTRTFTDKSIGATSWLWDFGDGTTSTEQNPVHTYIFSGTYVVKLTVSNDNCTDDVTHTVKIINEEPQFSYSPVDNFCKSEPVSFNAFNYNSTSVNSFTWVFGDGFTSGDGPAVTHKYLQSGTYQPYLIVGYTDGCRDTVQQGEHTIHLFGPSAAFTAPEGVCLNSPVTFTDQSTTDGTHGIVNWKWKFGDGSEETFVAPPFTHTYGAAGTYPVTLTVEDELGCRDTTTKARNVTIAQPVAAFALLDSMRCVETEATFLNNSQGVGLKYQWDFGDGITSAEQSPIHKYAQEGVYSVKLSITDKFGCTDSILLPDIITISNPVASFILNDTFGICPPLLIQPENTSSHYTSVQWNFGDGNTTNIVNPVHYYNIPGHYDIMMIAHGHGECYDTAYSSVLLKGPSGNFSYAPLDNCIPTEIKFTAVTKQTSSYIWDFSNGITKETRDSVITFTYQHTGNYLPKLIISDSSGCQVGITGADTIRVGTVTAGFTFTQGNYCDSAQFIFTDSTILDNTSIIGYHWLFNGMDSSTDPHPVYYFKEPGQNEVTLTITTDLGCTDKITKKMDAVIYRSPDIVLSAPDSLCLNLPVYYKAADENKQEGITWSWNFGDGNTSSEQEPVYNYAASNRYTVWVKGTNPEGCFDSVSQTIDILALPVVSAGVDEAICRNLSVNLQANGASTYLWSPPQGLDCLNCASPTATPDSTTLYHVTGTDAFGCINTDSVWVTVVQPITVNMITNNDTLCIGESTQLSVNGAAFYNWSPTTGLSDASIPNPVASPTATTEYTVIGYSDSSHCFSDTTNIMITVGQLPELSFPDSLISMGAGSAYPMNPVISPDVVTMSWSPPYGLSCADCLRPVAQPTMSTTYTATAYNIYGCYTRQQMRIEVVCNNSNVYIPNTFSPNNDGHNDYFFVRGSGLFNVKRMQVFNRWGLPVFAKNNIGPSNEKAGWDGKYHGKEQEAGVYVYVIEIQCENGSVLVYKGNVTLLR